MGDNMRNIICTILARGGSKGVKNKNIKLMNGLPLIAHSIIQAQKTNLFSSIIVSSDSDDILNIARDFKVDHLIKRPHELADDNAPKIPAIQHAVLETEKKINTKFDYIIDLDPTSPLRNVEDIINAFNMLLNENATNIITACPSRKSPYFNMVKINNENVATLPIQLDQNIFRRQDSPKVYDMNASIYIWSSESLFRSKNLWQERTKLYVMPEERSIDIDTELDFEIVDLLLRKKIIVGDKNVP